jgi:hypothetical protein
MYRLRYVTYSCSLMTHGACQRCRKSRASQSCTRFAAAVRPSTGCRRQDGSRLLGLATTSLSIPSASRASEEGCSGRRCQDCFYRQTVLRAGPTFAVLRQHKGFIAGRHCEPRSGGLSCAEGKAWVIGHEVGTPRFSWNIDLIVCYRQNWSRFTRCCYRIGDGLLDAQNPRQIRRTH